LIFTLRNEVHSPSWNGMFTLLRYKLLNATGISTSALKLYGLFTEESWILSYRKQLGYE